MKDKRQQSVLESARIANDLRLAKAYWQKTIQCHIAGRSLRGGELYVATDAYFRLQELARRAVGWNNTDSGKRFPIPTGALPDFANQPFLEPDATTAF